MEIKILGFGCYYLLLIPADLFKFAPEVAVRFLINEKRKLLSANRMVFLEM